MLCFSILNFVCSSTGKLCEYCIFYVNASRPVTPIRRGSHLESLCRDLASASAASPVREDCADRRGALKRGPSGSAWMRRSSTSSARCSSRPTSRPAHASRTRLSGKRPRVRAFRSLQRPRLRYLQHFRLFFPMKAGLDHFG